ncbi:C45 family peptidase [Horticoccus luteus]|uniref:C45 family peptidase n=1 Tax=Horticoccus luteus TaxID=2862869 RepID=A0A8F9XM41_9BACT|nr:carcinine hydrolase/isopenicillin-N N-acyltransferase family protein [Horticoccus luteus]QYM79659.1 C45 family peptidase [Horticoccus luteus]
MNVPLLSASRLRRALGLALTFTLGAFEVRACTLWAAVAPNEGGTIIAKNRDWKPDHTQVLKLRRGKGYAYFGLYAVGNDEPGLKEGVNEKGLCVVTATAGSIPKAMRKAQSSKRGGVTAMLLAKYAMCDEVLADAEKLFHGRNPIFLMISDHTKILTLEVGLDGRFAVKVTAAGHAAHTNHFLEPALADCNLKIGESSATRFRRISELLEAAPGPLDTAAFATMSADRYAGDSDSLWRVGKGSITLSSWILETPAKGDMTLRVVLANPGQPKEEKRFVLDEKFWKQHG